MSEKSGAPVPIDFTSALGDGCVSLPAQPALALRDEAMLHRDVRIQSMAPMGQAEKASR
jgi:hypothetical protein